MILLWKIASRLAIEAYKAGKAQGIHFSFSDPIQYLKNFGSKMPDARPSMLLDLKAQRLTEVDAINGMVPQVAKAQGLNAPYNEVITALIKAKEQSSRRIRDRAEITTQVRSLSVGFASPTLCKCSLTSS